MSEWSEVRLGDLVDGYRGVSYHPSDLLEEQANGSVILLRANNIQNGQLIFDDIHVVPQKIVKPEQILSQGDIAVCMSNGSKRLVGKSAQLAKAKGFKCTVGAFCAVFRPKDYSESAFVRHLFGSHSYQAQIDISLAGSAINNLKNSDIESIPISIPPKFMRKKIARILSTLDEAIEKTDELIGKYEQIKAGMMHDLFTRGLTPDGQLRAPRSEAPHLYQETPIGWIPKEWGFSVMRDKAAPGDHHLKSGPFGSALKGEHWVEDGHPAITIGALGEGFFITSELLHVGAYDAKRLSAFMLKLGDVVFSRVADVGRSAVIKYDQVGWIMSSNLMRISLDRKQVLPEFLQYQLSSDSRVKIQIRQKVNSSGREVANNETLNSLVFAWPTFEEQNAIVERADAVAGRIIREWKYMNKLQKQKSGLLHDLLTGRVPVRVEEEAVADVG